MLPGRRSLAALALLAVGCAAVSPTHPRFLRVGNACASSFDEATDQIGGTWCCWILSALEGARAQRILTADNLCNKFGASFDFQAKRIPKWQELAQAKMAEDSSCYYGGGEGTWQKKITPATMGCNRQDKLPLKFAKLGLQMTTDKFKDVYTVEATTSEAKAPDFFMGQPPAGHAYIYTYVGVKTRPAGLQQSFRRASRVMCAVLACVVPLLHQSLTHMP